MIDQTRRRTAALGCFFLLLHLASLAAAQVSCGDVIAAGSGTVVLTATDPITSGACAVSPALTVTGPGTTLDLNAFTIECDSSNDGILVTGGPAELRNGTVDGCAIGVDVQTRAHLNKVVARNNDEGFVVSNAEKSSFIDCVANDNASHGWRLTNNGARHNLARNLALGNGGVGFFLEAVSAIQLKQNVAVNNGSHGFVIDGGGNKVIGNTASGNDGDGFATTAVPLDSTRMVKNTAVDNGGDGFDLGGGLAVKVIGNTSARNMGNGFVVGTAGSADSMKFGKNIASGNGSNGVRIDLAAGGKFVKNVVTNNAGNGIVIDANVVNLNIRVLRNHSAGNNPSGVVGSADVHDRNLACNGGSNIWSGDQFASELVAGSADTTSCIN